MGLLEKAGKIQTEEPSPPAVIDAPDTIVLPDPEPVKEKPTKKAKIRKERPRKLRKRRRPESPKSCPKGLRQPPKANLFSDASWISSLVMAGRFRCLRLLLGVLTSIRHPWLSSASH